MPSIVKKALIRIVPISFVIGATFEFIMIKTGFYDIVIAKKAQEIEDQMRQEKIMFEKYSKYTYGEKEDKVKGLEKDD